MSTWALLANVVLSHGLFGLLLVAAAIYTAVPPAALGVSVPSAAEAAVGVALGVGLCGASEVGAAVARRFGIDADEQLREMLAPETPTGWVLLLVVALPVVAGFEDLLFRAALIGAPAAGFDVSPWPLAALSSLAFGFGHGVQGTGGVIVTTVLGFVLAATFVLTGSLAVVVIAHYVVNALEFVVHEGIGVEWR
jgi:membrane protease YdiL (CAAX protease family)